MRRHGFTLVELLLTIGIIGILAAITIVAINPLRQLGLAEDARRRHHAREMGSAIGQFFIEYDHLPGDREIPEGMENAVPTCRAGSMENGGCINLDELITSDANFLPCLPRDGRETHVDHSGFAVYQQSGRVFIMALHLGEPSGGSTCEKPPKAFVHWKFDEGNGTTVKDASGSGYDGTFVNGPTWETSVPAHAIDPYALSFNGNDQYVSISGGGGLSGLNTGSISLWVKWNGIQSNRGYMMNRQSNGFFSKQSLGLTGNNPAMAQIEWRPYRAMTAVNGTTNVGDGIWRHIVITYAYGNHHGYMDGHEEFFSEAISQGQTTMDADSSIPLTIGAWIGDGGSYCTCSVDDVRIYSTILTEGQILTLFRGGP